MGGRGWWHLSVGTRKRDRRGRESIRAALQRQDLMMGPPPSRAHPPTPPRHPPRPVPQAAAAPEGGDTTQQEGRRSPPGSHCPKYVPTWRPRVSARRQLPTSENRGQDPAGVQMAGGDLQTSLAVAPEEVSLPLPQAQGKAGLYGWLGLGGLMPSAPRASRGQALMLSGHRPRTVRNM